MPCLAKQNLQDVEASGEPKIAARALLPHHIIRLSLWKMNMVMLGKRLSFIGRQFWKTDDQLLKSKAKDPRNGI